MLRGSSRAEVIEYNGHRYRRYPNSSHAHHQRYFYATEPRRGFLHRHMWEDARGPIPAGHDIHHKDGNWDNNSLDNFECLTKGEHRQRHPMDDARLEAQLVHLGSIRYKAAKWHKSIDGKAWHSEHGADTWIDRSTVAKVCAACGSNFDAYFDRALFCSNGCKQRGVGGGPTKRGRFSAQGESINCKCCHRLFTTNWPESAAYCSKACGMRYRSRGPFKPGEGPKPHRKPRARLLCQRDADA